MSTQPCVQTQVCQIRVYALVTVFRMEKKLLLNAIEITTYLEMKKFGVMVECGAAQNPDAKVITKKKTVILIEHLLQKSTLCHYTLDYLFDCLVPEWSWILIIACVCRSNSNV